MFFYLLFHISFSQEILDREIESLLVVITTLFYTMDLITGTDKALVSREPNVPEHEMKPDAIQGMAPMGSESPRCVTHLGSNAGILPHSPQISSHLEYEYLRFTTLRTLKKNFLKYSGVDPSYEAGKVWANWVIVNRINTRQVDPFLPTEGLHLDNKTVSLLIEKGCHEQDAIRFYSNFIQQCQRWQHRFNYYRLAGLGTLETEIGVSTPPPGLEEIIPVKLDGGIKVTEGNNNPEHSIDHGIYHAPTRIIKHMDTYSVEYRGIHHTIVRSQFCSLLKKYTGNYPYFDLWKMLNHYFLLDGLSYQWSLPPATFKLLREQLGVRTELFASPLNHHLDNYYSLFPDNDTLFGSRGDFFQSSWNDFREGGIYEANPPFIESIFVRTSQILIHYLNNAIDQGVHLSFIFIMPAWLDSFGYQRLRASRFLFKELIFQKHCHSYWEYRKDKYITAHFDSHVLLLTSDSNALGDIWTNSVEHDFSSSFALA